MKHTYRFAQSIGKVTCRLASGSEIELPVIPGILKHPSPEALRELLRKPDVASKYTRQALCKASWPILKQFPRDWLLMCIEPAKLPEIRKRALLFLLT